MSIYNIEGQASSSQGFWMSKSRLYGFLGIFNRNYADFIRMLCDNVIIDCLEDSQKALRERLIVFLMILLRWIKSEAKSKFSVH